MAYSHYRQITVDKTKCGETDANFAVLISGTYDGTGGEPDLRTVANGGKIQNTASGGASGTYTIPADLVFSPNADGSSPYDFEIEKYNAATGEIVAWVQCGVDTAADTVFYMVYGDSGVTTSQENVAGTWDANFMMVQHMAGDNWDALDDSTSNSRDITSDNSAPTYNQSAQIGNGVEFDGLDDRVTRSSSDTGITNALTVEAIIKLDTDANAGIVNLIPSSGRANEVRLYYFAGTNELDVACRKSDDSDYIKDFLSAGTISLATWYHIAATWDGTDLHIYIGGSQSIPYTKNIDNSGSMTNTDRLIHIGYDSAGDLDWDGLIDEVRISSVARTANYITTCFNNQSSPSTFYSVGNEVMKPPRYPAVVFQCPAIV